MLKEADLMPEAIAASSALASFKTGEQNQHPGRRSLLAAIAALATGAAIAAPVSVFGKGLGPADPILGFIAQKHRLEAECCGGVEDDEVKALCDQINVIENAAVDTVAISTAGLIAQVDLLRSYLEPNWADERELRLCDTIETGIRRLTAATSA